MNAPAPSSPNPSVPLWQHRDDHGVFNDLRACAPCPAVFTLHESRVTITKQWQFYIRAINSGMLLKHVTALFGPTKAFTNRPVRDTRPTICWARSCIARIRSLIRCEPVHYRYSQGRCRGTRSS